MAGFDATASRLRDETSGLVNVFSERAKKVRGSKELLPLFKHLDDQKSRDVALEFFGEGEHRAVGIDGSMTSDELLEMVIFYINASAFSCPFTLSRDGFKFLVDDTRREERLDVSSTVPIWMEDLPAVVPSTSVDTDYDLSAVSAKLPFAMMAMGEITIADRVVSSGSARIVFMDRPLSGTHGPLARDFRELLKRSKLSVEGLPTPYGPLTKLDLALAYYLHDGSLRMPKRRRFLYCHALKRLLGGEKLSYGSLAHDLGVDEDDAKAMRKGLERLCHNGNLLEVGAKKHDTHVKLTDDARHYWRRVMYVLNAIQDRVFTGGAHPLRLDSGDWISELELNALNLLLLRELSRKSLERRILVIGIAKDTLATEFGRTVIPYSGFTSSSSSDESLWSMRSDKSLLNIFSTSENVDVPTPWRTLGYDAAFGSLVVTEARGPKLVAARRRMANEQQFVRSYFELRSLSSDPKSKSSVFLYDRSFWPEFDERMVRREQVSEERRAVNASLYFEGKDNNPLDNLILKILSCSDNPNVVEAFGHNHLLFLADKAVKADARTARAMLKGIVWLELGPLARSDRLFNCARRFRDIRSESEQARERAASK